MEQNDDFELEKSKFFSAIIDTFIEGTKGLYNLINYGGMHGDERDKRGKLTAYHDSCVNRFISDIFDPSVTEVEKDRYKTILAFSEAMASFCGAIHYDFVSNVIARVPMFYKSVWTIKNRKGTDSFIFIDKNTLIKIIDLIDLASSNIKCYYYFKKDEISNANVLFEFTEGADFDVFEDGIGTIAEALNRCILNNSIYSDVAMTSGINSKVFDGIGTTTITKAAVPELKEAVAISLMSLVEKIKEFPLDQIKESQDDHVKRVHDEIVKCFKDSGVGMMSFSNFNPAYNIYCLPVSFISGFSTLIEKGLGYIKKE